MLMRRDTSVVTVRPHGSRVRLKGITGLPHLNGQCGSAGSYDSEKNRQSVILDSGESVMVRLECMEDAGPVAFAPPTRSPAPLPGPSPVGSAAMGAFHAVHAATSMAKAAGPSKGPSPVASTPMEGFREVRTEPSRGTATGPSKGPSPAVSTGAAIAGGAEVSVGVQVEVQFAGFPALFGTVVSISEDKIDIVNDESKQMTRLPRNAIKIRVIDAVDDLSTRLSGVLADTSTLPEYHKLTEQFGKSLEKLTLKGLFDFLDKDGSGNLSVSEVEKAVPLISDLLGVRDGSRVRIDVTAIDEDGNGVISFYEFAEWAGPRLGLPLGVRLESSACGIIGCPCHCYRPRKKLKKRRTFISTVLRKKAIEDVDICECKHKKSAHHITSASGEVPYPDNWRNSKMPCELVTLPFTEHSIFQNLLDQTYLNIWTRDRKKHNPSSPSVPKGFRVTGVIRAENKGNWKEYVLKKSQILEERAKAAPGSWQEIDDVKSNLSARNATICDGPFPLSSACNEWYLFHGTSPDAARAICNNDFRISFAGGNTGTLYGKGIYLAESITKADEYAQQDAGGDYSVLLCRALGGLVRYTDELEPDVEELVRDCIEGPYGCVMGDREKCRGTFREFVVFDTEDVYPEYIIMYQRL